MSVRLRDARLAYADQLLFDGLDLDLEGGLITCLLGPSGVGKSSLLRLLAGLAPSGVESGRMACDDGRPLAGRSAYMAQSDLLLPWLTVLDNVCLGARLRGEPRDRQRALYLLERVGLAAQAAHRPAALSGGMRQRVALARTLMEDRPVVLMDEPFSAVDEQTRRKFQEDLLNLLSVEKKTVIFVTHSIEEAVYLSSRVVLLSRRPGRVSKVIKTELGSLESPDAIRRSKRYLDTVEDIWGTLKQYLLEDEVR